jgi:predicted lactoylglutathione lyase
MPKMIYLNLPVKDLAAATSFYERSGAFQQVNKPV